MFDRGFIQRGFLVKFWGGGGRRDVAVRCEDGEKISGIDFFGPRKKGVTDHVIPFSNLFWPFLLAF